MQNGQAWEAIIEARTPVRVLCIVYPASPLFEQSAISSITLEALQRLGAQESDAKILILSTWPNRTLVVFDLWHSQYDFQTAHQCELISVIAIHFQTQTRIKVGMAIGDEVNPSVADLHKWHGYNPLPIVEDHRNGNAPTHENPRED